MTIIKQRTNGVNYKQVNRYLARESRKYTDTMQEVPKEEWPPTTPTKCRPISLWRSRQYMAQVVEEPSGVIRISINKVMIDEKYQYRDGISWDDLQRIKNEIGFAAHDCIELYPAKQDVINVANIRHLFVLDEKHPYNWTNDETGI